VFKLLANILIQKWENSCQRSRSCVPFCQVTSICDH